MLAGGRVMKISLQWRTLRWRHWQSNLISLLMRRLTLCPGRKAALEHTQYVQPTAHLLTTEHGFLSPVPDGLVVVTISVSWREPWKMKPAFCVSPPDFSRSFTFPLPLLHSCTESSLTIGSLWLIHLTKQPITGMIAFKHVTPHNQVGSVMSRGWLGDGVQLLKPDQ